MLCFQRNWFRADLCEMARSCSKLQQVDKLCKYAENSTIKVFYWGWLRVPGRIVKKSAGAALFLSLSFGFACLLCLTLHI